MEKIEKTSPEYEQAAEIIKKAILRSQYAALSKVNMVQLSLYYSIGRYISLNTRNGKWGVGALKHISLKLKNDMPGLRGFSEPSLRKMRIFYEEWRESFVETNELMTIENAHDILIQIRSLERTNLNEEDFKNFEKKIKPINLARRAVMAFKDEYILDFINTEQIGERDVEDIDERVIEQQIVQNIKNFILTFGHNFAFMGNQFRIDAFGESHFIDLLFFNRELACMVAIELKSGKLKSSYMGQLRDYLALLDDFVKKPHENSSIGIVLCKDADRTRAEYLIQQYDKPMGVATYRTRQEMPEKLRNALPDIEDLKKLL
ncbi:MAG: PDDEXK nuclease domain-containing protein [Bacteroidales bacterium]|nr:PDDEXK nuclease domain-containing protein [Bacteroidales bacterium]